MTPLVVGIDAGATTTRCLVATVEGEVVTTARGPGANRWSSGDHWTDQLTAVLRTALADVDVGRVCGGYFGIAGAGGAFPLDQVVTCWHDQGLQGRPVVVEDGIVSYAAGTVEPEGLLLLSGTGALAAWVREFVTVRRCDGVGWWLGDEGSAVWIARAAVHAVLAAMDGRGPDTTLVPAVIDGQSVDEVIAQVYGNPPATLGRIAPLVDASARLGDSVAQGIITEAAERLLNTVGAARRAAGSADLPIVLAGSVLVGGSLVGALVAAAVQERFGVTPQQARDGAAGAAALAIRQVLGDQAVARAAHERLISGSV